MEIRWFKETDCVYLYQNGQVTEGRGYEGNVSLNLRDVQRSDGGEYRCEIIRGKCKMESEGVHLQALEFKLVSRAEDVGKPSDVQPLEHTPFQWCSRYTGSACAFYGDDVTLQCFLSPESSAVAMEIRWFKETDCVYLYQNGQVTEGRGYEGKVSVNPDELRRGNVSLNLRDVQGSDGGKYWCEVTDGGQKVKNKEVHLSVSGSLYIPPMYTVWVLAGDDVSLQCCLMPETSAVTMEIRWFKETDCVYLYQNGQVTEGRSYEGRVSVNPDELPRGKVSLNLRDVQRSDGGEYRCEIIRGKCKMESKGVRLCISEFKVELVSVHLGYDVTLRFYLTPETNAVPMEIRWFKGTDCIYLYQNGQVTEGRGYEGRVSVNSEEMQRGNMSLKIRRVQWSDCGEYRCEVTDEQQKVYSSAQFCVLENPKRRFSDSRDHRPSKPEKPGRRWSNDLDFPNSKSKGLISRG
ncbi:butyrophilin-like protein 2 [Salminus brasiliensis]|uniref:butyrophilin-like protein 2 n=1 Tax=Salminus brasiliensis TaxID=930266 RepID=UPI003B834F51